MRTAVALSLAVFASACGSSDPCAGLSGTCVTLTVTSSQIAHVDTLGITASGAVTGTQSSAAKGPQDLPVKVALRLPADATGTLHLDVEARQAGSVVGAGSTDGTVVSGKHISMMVDVEPTGVVGGGDDMATNGDGAGGTGGSGGGGADAGVKVPSFAAGRLFAAGKAPFRVAVGDFNRDGHLDAAAVNYRSNSVSILLGLGDGTMQPQTSIDVGASPDDLVVADFDGKNGPDIAVATGQPAGAVTSLTVRVLLNDGTGKLALDPTVYSVGSGTANYIRVGDFDKDGHPDVATLNYGSTNTNTGAFSILINRGDGSGGLLTARTTATSSDAYDFAVVGTDIAVIKYVGTATPTTTVVVYKNNGFGYFDANSIKGPYPTTSTNIAAADFDGKNGADVLLYGGGGTAVMLNDGTGGLGTATTVSGLPMGCRSVAALDLDADGYGDLACSGTSGVSVLYNKADGSATFGAATTSPAVVSTLAFGDFNGDGALDVAGPGPGSQLNGFAANVDVLLADRTKKGAFISPTSYPTLNSQLDSVVTADFNGDALPDIVALQTMGGLSVRLNGSGGNLGARTDYSLTYSSAPYLSAVAAGDINGDQKPDVVVAARDPNLNILLNVGDGSGKLATATALPVGKDNYDVALVDVDGKNGLDLVVAGAETATGMGGVFVALNDGHGNFATPTSFGGPAPQAIAAADFNGDGAVDLATADNNVATVFLNDGTGHFGSGTTYAVGTTPIHVIAGDITGDQAPDLLVANLGDSSITVLKNKADKSGTFTKLTDLTNVDSVRRLALADVNQKGKLDVLALSPAMGAVVLFPNLGGTLGSPLMFDAGSLQAGGMTTADVNGDGLPDVVVAGMGAYNVMLNNSR